MKFWRVLFFVFCFGAIFLFLNSYSRASFRHPGDVLVYSTLTVGQTAAGTEAFEVNGDSVLYDTLTVGTTSKGSKAFNLTGSGSISTDLVIGDTSIDSSSILELESTTKGFLPPRMDQTARDAISSPATGLMIYNTDTDFLNYYNGTSWLVAGSTGASDGMRTCSGEFGGATENVNACTADPCTVYVDNENCISSVNRNSTGNYYVNFETGFFSDKPLCTCSGGFLSSDAPCHVRRQSATQIRIWLSNGSAVDDEVSIICRGPE